MPTRTRPTPSSAGAEVLVADDEPNIRTTISDVLRRILPTSRSRSCGRDGDRPSSSNADFDLVISDIKMPDKSGYDVFACARRKSTHTPVILMTGFGYDPNHSIVRASQEGLQAVLFKPFKVDQLLAEVRKAPQIEPQPGAVKRFNRTTKTRRHEAGMSSIVRLYPRDQFVFE